MINAYEWLRPTLFSALTVIAAASSAGASTITFNNRGAFNAAAGATDVITFESLPVGAVAGCTPGFPFVPDPCVLTIGNVSFVSTLGFPPFQRALLSVDNTLGAPPSKGLLSNNPASAPGGFYADVHSFVFGIDVISGVAANNISIVFSSVGGADQTFDIVAGPNIPTFFGVISSTELTRVSFFTHSQANFSLDNAATSPVATAVPEPATILMLGTLLPMAIRSVRTRRQSGMRPRCSTAHAVESLRKREQRSRDGRGESTVTRFGWSLSRICIDGSARSLST